MRSRQTISAARTALGVAALVASVKLGAQSPARRLVAANSEAWDVQDNALGNSDTGAILTGGPSQPFNGFGYLRLTVYASGRPVVENETLRGFGLSPNDRTFRSSKPVVRAGILVERIITAPAGSNYLRYFDTFTNFTGQPRRVLVAWGGGVGWSSPRIPAVIAQTSDGDRLLERTDAYAAIVGVQGLSSNPLTTRAERGPTAMVVGSSNNGALTGFGGGDDDPLHTPYRSPNSYLSARYELALGPGQSVSLVTFAVKGRAERAPRDAASSAPTAGSQLATVIATADSLTRHPDLTGLSSTELRQIANWRSIAAIPPAAPFGVSVVETDVDQLQRAMTERRTSAEQLSKQYLARIAAYDGAGPRLNAMVVVNPHALEDANTLDRERERGSIRGPLHGIPVILKDNYNTSDLPTSVGSLALAGFTPPHDATLVAKLRAAGAVIIGKANMDEFAWGNATISGVIGQTRNAYDPERSAAGSSGGSATAAAASFAAFTLGTDACNSLSFPAALASLVTMRGSLGLVSLSGIAPGLPLQDMAGPLTRSVRDLARALDALVGEDPADSNTLQSRGHIPPTYLSSLNPKALRGARLGVLRDMYPPDSVEAGVDSVIQAGIRVMRGTGATFIDVAVPNAQQLLDESSSFTIRGEFGVPLGKYLADRTELPYHTTAELAASGKLLPDKADIFTRVGKRADGTTGTVGFGASSLNLDARAKVIAARARFRAAIVSLMDSLKLDALVYPSNLARADVRESASSFWAGGTCETSAQTGLPQLTVPAGWIDNRYAVGIQFLGRSFDEARLLSLGYSFEQLTHHRRQPPLTP